MEQFLKQMKGPACAGLLLACFADAILLWLCQLEMTSARNAQQMDALLNGTWILAIIAFVVVFLIVTVLGWFFTKQTG